MSDIVDKVQKLLNKAENAACTPEEAESLWAKAQELMTLHAITEATLALAADGRKEPVAQVAWAYSPNDQNIPAKQTLLGVVAKANRCRAAFYSAPRERRDYTALLVGRGGDVEYVKVLFTSALIQARRAAGRERGWSGKALTHAERTGFMLGFAAAVKKRLEGANDAASTGRDLVPVRKAEEDVERAFAAATTVGRSVARRSFDGRHYGSGAAAGARADLSGGRTQVSRQRKALR